MQQPTWRGPPKLRRLFAPDTGSLAKDQNNNGAVYDVANAYELGDVRRAQGDLAGALRRIRIHWACREAAGEKSRTYG